MEENTRIVQAEVDNFFEGVKSKIHPPPEQKIDPVKVKRTLATLKRPPKSPVKGNYERILTKSFMEASRSECTISGQR